MFKELDSVILTHDIDSHGLKEGDKGAIVHVHEGGSAFEVEFVDSTTGRTIALLNLSPADICLEGDIISVVDWTMTKPITKVSPISDPSETTTDTDEFIFLQATL